MRILPTENANILTLFQKGEIDGAWVPEPWATRLMLEGGGTVFIDERDLWPDGQFTTTGIIVRTGFLEGNPSIAAALIRANVKAILLIEADPGKAKELSNRQIATLTGKLLRPEVIENAWHQLHFTYDPIVESWVISADRAFDLGMLGHGRPRLDQLFSLDILNAVLAADALPLVSAQ